jgi:cation diffusion facilitator CzcD-associated flavoprotein CzcO
VIFERAPELGGTWWANSYPGCQCDVPSHLYSFSFAMNPDWSRTYSMQGEILAYLKRVATEEGVLPHLRLSTPVLDARWDATDKRWHVTTPDGSCTADALIMGNGPLSEPKLPDTPGLELFTGMTFHSAAWDHSEDLTGKRVAVVGTGASAIQFVPYISKVAGKVTIFQRTPPWVVPHRDRPIRRWEKVLYRYVPVAQKTVRGACYVAREALLPAFAKRPARMKAVSKMARQHLENQVADSDLRARLTPAYTPGCKRLLLSNDWYPALCRPNVEVVSSGVAEVRANSVVAADGSEREVDTIIFATGFHVTDNPVMSVVRGRDGRSLAEVWASDGMAAHKGTTVGGFPNLFLLAGPNTGIGHTSLVFMIESQLRYVMDALCWVGAGYAVDVRPGPMADYNAAVQTAMAPSVWNTGGCVSWYQDAKGRNPTIWPDFTWRFHRMTRTFDTESYQFEKMPVLEPELVTVHQ